VFGRATIRLGIGPHSSAFFTSLVVFTVMNCNAATNMQFRSSVLYFILIVAPMGQET